MQKIKIRENYIDVFDDWSEISTDVYFKINELKSSLDSGEIIEMEFMVKFISLIGNLDEKYVMQLYDEELLPFIDAINTLNSKQFREEPVDHFLLDGKLYSFNKMSRITTGENISIEYLKKGAMSGYDMMLNTLSILIRGAKEGTDSFGDKIYIVDPFEGDADIITKRKELIKKIPATNSVYIINLFINGRK